MTPRGTNLQATDGRRVCGTLGIQLEHASQAHYNFPMKTATLPSIRVKPELRSEVEALLNDNESLSEFVETSVRESVRRRRNQVEFIARGIAALESAKDTDDYVDADVLIESLKRKLGAAKASQAAGKR